MILSTHEVYIYNHSGNLINLLEGWTRLEYHQKLNGLWYHQITYEFGSESPQITELDSLQPDYLVRIYRTNVETGTKTRVYEGFHLTTVKQERKSGDYIVNLYGTGLLEVLKRRIVLPTAGSDVNYKRGAAETVLKEYVSESAVSPVDGDRIIPGLSIQGDGGQGGTVEYSARYTRLFTILESLAEEGDVDFGVVGLSEVDHFEFRIAPLWGVDRRVDNSAGNDPIIFSTRFGNAAIPILTNNTAEERNVVYVGGRGIGTEREILEQRHPTAPYRSPWARKEGFYDARQQEESALSGAGDAYLEKYKAFKTLTMNILQVPSNRWPEDWSLGDLVTAEAFGDRIDKQIIEIGVIIADNEQLESLNVEFEDV